MTTEATADYFDMPLQRRQLYAQAYNELQKEFPDVVLPVYAIERRMGEIETRQTQPERALGEQLELSGTMVTSSPEKVDGLKLIGSPDGPDKYAFVSPALTDELLSRYNNHTRLVAALEQLMTRFEQTGEAWMSDPAWIAANDALSRVRG